MMLTAKQKRFVEAYVANANGARAAIQAGYSARTARVIASENLRKPEIAAAIDKATQRRTASERARTAKVREELGKIAFADITEIFGQDNQVRDPSEWPDQLKEMVNYSKSERIRRNSLGEETERVVTHYQVAIHGRLKALKLLADSLGMFPRRALPRVREATEDKLGMKLSNADHRAMDSYVAGVLEAYKAGEIDFPTAQNDLLHAMCAAALGNEGTFKAFIRIPLTKRCRRL